MTFRLRDPRPMRQPRVPERAIQAQVVHLLRSIGAEVYIFGTVRPSGDTPGTFQTRGIPDLYVFLPTPPVTGNAAYAPRTLWIEVKAKGGQLRAEQDVFRERCIKAAQAHLVGGVEDVLSFLRCYGWLKAA